MKQQLSRRNPFEKTNQNASTMEIMGGLMGLDDPLNIAQIRRVEKIEIMQLLTLLPNFWQPRRTFPSAIRNLWDGKAESVKTLFEPWFELASRERGKAIDWIKYLTDPEIQKLPDPGPIEFDLLDLIDFTITLRDQGQGNPVHIVKRDGYNEIEQGERRWLGHHLLHWYYNDEKYLSIECRIVEELNVWRQAMENGQRKPLTAIAQARQIANLIMDYYAKVKQIQFKDYFGIIQDGGSDRDFYAQVADGEQYPLRGFAQAVVTVTGLKSADQVGQYRRLLRAPDELWAKADDENWSEGAIREALEKLEKSPTTVGVPPSKPTKKPPYVRILNEADRGIMNTVTNLNANLLNDPVSERQSLIRTIEKAEQVLARMKQRILDNK